MLKRLIHNGSLWAVSFTTVVITVLMSVNVASNNRCFSLVYKLLGMEIHTYSLYALMWHYDLLNEKEK